MTDAKCWACDKAGNDCDAAASATSAKGVLGSTADAKFTFKQDGAKSTAVLAVKDVVHQPNSKTAFGRFYFKPSTSMSLYATSDIQLSFGGQTFG